MEKALAYDRVVQNGTDSTGARYWLALWRRWWLLLALALAGVAAAGLVSRLSMPRYQSSASILLNSPSPASVVLPGGGNVVSSDVQARYDETQARIATTRAVAARAIRAARASLSPDELLKETSTAVDPASDIMQLRVSANSRATATRLANAYARAFVRTVTSANSADIPRALSALEASLRDLTIQVNGLSVDSTAQADLRQQIATILSEEVQLRTIASVAGGRVRVIEPAVAATQISPRSFRNAILGGVAGLFIAIGAVGVISVVDRRPQFAADVATAVDCPRLGTVPPRGRHTLSRRKGCWLPTMMGGEADAAFTQVRLALAAAGLIGGGSTLAVASAHAGSGTTTVVANLALSLSQSGARVAVVDLDLRSASLHRCYGLERAPGFTDAAVAEADTERALYPVPFAEPAMYDLAQLLNQDGSLVVMPAGSPTAKPDRFLAPSVFKPVLEQVSAVCDVLLLDLPPLLETASAAEVAAVANASILVVRSGHGLIEEVAHADEILRHAGAHVVGHVLNGFR